MNTLTKFSACAFASLAAACSSVASHGEKVATGKLPPGDYKLLFEDNFDGDKFDASQWYPRLGRRGGEDPAAGWINALNREENVTVDGGMMRIRHARETIDGKAENTCGGLISRKRFGYGYYEARFKPLMLKGRGTHAAFWQRGTQRGDARYDDATKAQYNVIFEIDGSELSSPHWKGTNNLYVQILPGYGIYSDTWPHRCTVPVAPDAEGFVVDAWEYRPDGIIFYDNGREVGRTGFNHIRGQQEVWLTSLAGAHWREMDPSELPGEALFDYFRYYAKDWPGHNLLANAAFEYNTDKISPQNPVAWRELGDKAASTVSAPPKGPSGKAVLRHGSDKPYAVTTDQTLQHLLDGTYTASARVRSSGGQKTARFVITSGGKSKQVEISASAEWTTLQIPAVEVTGNEVTIAFVSDASAGQWLEVDDVVFMKPPLPGQAPVIDPPFALPTDPPYVIFDDKLRSFADGRHYLIDRGTGAGEAVSVAFDLRQSKLVDQTAIEKFPVSGSAGWSVQLTSKGELVFVVGSQKSNTRLVVPDAYMPNKVTQVVAVFDRGRAMVYLDGKLAGSRDGIAHSTTDATAPGCMGIYWTRNGQTQSFDGELGHVRIYNRAVSPSEVLALPTFR